MNEIHVRRMPDGTWCLNLNGRLVDEGVEFEHLGVHVDSLAADNQPCKVVYRA